MSKLYAVDYFDPALREAEFELLEAAGWRVAFGNDGEPEQATIFVVADDDMSATDFAQVRVASTVGRLPEGDFTATALEPRG